MTGISVCDYRHFSGGRGIEIPWEGRNGTVEPVRGRKAEILGGKY